MAESTDLRVQWGRFTPPLGFDLDSDDPMTAQETELALSRVGRNRAPGLLWDLFCARRLERAVLAAVLVGVWSAAEWPEYTLKRSVWLTWFRMAAYQKPPETLTIYRGATPRYSRGMAWTTDEETAAWFARRWCSHTGLDTYVYTVSAPPRPRCSLTLTLWRTGARRGRSWSTRHSCRTSGG
ncbi:MAG: hypothetical protein ABI452_02845 [Candidatus Limnocylindrales bacterium]